MVAAGIIVLVVVLTIGALIKRLMDLHALHPLVWPLCALAAAIPAWVSYTVLVPGEPLASAELRGLHEKVELEIPEGSALMVTARLAEPPLEPDPESEKTAYNLNVSGSGWEDALNGTIKRKTAKEGQTIDPLGRASIREEGKRRSGGIGEDLQDRHDLSGGGKSTIEVTNWAGGAAEVLVLEVVPAPPPAGLLWGAVAVITLLAGALEVKKGAERLASDLAFLASWGIFLRDGVTPLDDFQEVGLALAPAGLVGWGAVAGLTYLAIKMTAAPEPEMPASKKGESPKPVAPPPAPSTSAGGPVSDTGAAEPKAAVSETTPSAGETEADRASSRRGAAARRRANQGGEGQA
jgi:hypothetical protein